MTFFTAFFLTVSANHDLMPAPAARPAHLHFYNLIELQLHRGGAPEDDHRRLDPLALEIHLGDLAGEIRERAAGDPHVVAHLDIDDGRLLALDPCDDHLPAEDLADLRVLHRNRLFAGAHVLGDAGRLPDHAPGVVVEDHLHEDVARVLALLLFDPAPLLDLGHHLLRDDDAENPVLSAHGHDPLLDVLFDLVLVTGSGLHRVPAPLSIALDKGHKFSVYLILKRNTLLPGLSLADAAAVKARPVLQGGENGVPEEPVEGQHHERDDRNQKQDAVAFLDYLHPGRPADLVELDHDLPQKLARAGD